MKFGICQLSVIPLRLEPNDRSEIVSQILFGEAFEILEESEKWLNIRCIWDNYAGWIDHKQYTPLQSESEAMATLHSQVSINPVSSLENEKSNVHLSIGSTLSFNQGKIDIGDQSFRYAGRSAEIGSKAVEDIESLAKSWLNTPYLWGGRSIFGIDCSGFTQVVFKILGKQLHRDAYQQAEQGRLVNFIEEVTLGDLAFFDNDEEKIIHVGIILNDHQIIHASGKVRIDRIDHQGIFNTETKKYTHKLRIIKRLLS